MQSWEKLNDLSGGMPIVTDEAFGCGKCKKKCCKKYKKGKKQCKKCPKLEID